MDSISVSECTQSPCSIPVEANMTVTVKLLSGECLLEKYHNFAQLKITLGLKKLLFLLSPIIINKNMKIQKQSFRDFVLIGKCLN